MADFSKVAEWFTSGDTGISSMTIAAFMSGADCPRSEFDASPPADPADLGRCLRLLELFPEWKSRMPEMASVNIHWKKVLPHWDEAAALMADEVGIDWSKGRRAGRTYEFMKLAGF